MKTPPEDKMLTALFDQVQCARGIVLSSGLMATSDEFKENFRKKHPGADMVIGDFEIKCLHPEKFGFPTAPEKSPSYVISEQEFIDACKRSDRGEPEPA